MVLSRNGRAGALSTALLTISRLSLPASQGCRLTKLQNALPRVSRSVSIRLRSPSRAVSRRAVPRATRSANGQFRRTAHDEALRERAARVVYPSGIPF